MIDLAISLLVGAGVVCGTHHSHSDRDGLALPTPLTPLGKAHHFPLSTHSSAGPLRAILLALLAGGVARFGLVQPSGQSPCRRPARGPPWPQRARPHQRSTFPGAGACCARPCSRTSCSRAGTQRAPAAWLPRGASYSALQPRSGRPAPRPGPRGSPPLGVMQRSSTRCRDRPPRAGDRERGGGGGGGGCGPCRSARGGVGSGRDGAA